MRERAHERVRERVRERALERAREREPGHLAEAGQGRTAAPVSPGGPDAVTGRSPEPEPPGGREPGPAPGGRERPDQETDAQRRRRRAQFLRELTEAKELRARVQPRRARAARMRQAMRMRTFRW